MAKRRIAWAENQLELRGSYIITVARFIPGGRTATTFTAGYVEFPWRKFLVFDAIAAGIWGSYTVLLGYLGGSQFEKQPWKGLLLAFALALTVTGLIEAVRYLRHRRQAA
jgi:membrane protein DedA with SNARE-associated domain